MAIAPYSFPTTSSLQSFGMQQAQQYGVPYNVLDYVISNESRWNPLASNPTSSAYGIAQVLQSTAANPGYGVAPLVNRSDPFDSLRFASQYLRAMYDRVGNWNDAVLGYTGGLGYAQANPGAQPYASGPLTGTGGFTLASGSSGPRPAVTGSGVTQGTPGQPASPCSSWLWTPLACAQELTMQVGLVLLGLIIVGLTLWVIIRRM